MKPLVSVVVPNYNCEEYLDKCLEHIINQTYANFECIVCDNGSEDASVSIIRKWAAKDNRIKILINEENQGLINCYNRMFFEAKGDYIMIQDADDWCDITRIEKQLAIFENYDVGICLTNCIFYSDISEPAPEEKTGSKLLNVSSKEVWAPATMMFKREVLDKIPGYNQYFHRLSSYDRYLVLSILDEYGGYYLDDYLYFVWARHNSDHRSIDLSEPNALRKIISYDMYKLFKKQRLERGTDWLKEKRFDLIKQEEDKLIDDSNYIAEKIRAFGCIQVDYGNYNDAAYLIKEAIRKSPLYMPNYKSLLYLLRSLNKKKELQ